MITLDNWQRRMEEDMKLRDLRATTRKAYLRAVRQFVTWVGRAPDVWTEQDVRAYVLYLRDEKRSASSTIGIAIHALKFFLVRTLGRDWPVIDLVHSKRRRKLPVVLTRREVRSVLSVVRHPVCRMALTTIYGLGLRLSEALRLETSHIDAERRMVWVRNAKGGKDRGVVLPRPLLDRLRRYWRDERPQISSPHLFVSSRTCRSPHPTLLQRTFKAARQDAQLNKSATVHTLRHSYATHLLESGVSIRTIQLLLGHKSLRTTMGYTHMTHDVAATLQDTLDELMADL